MSELQKGLGGPSMLFVVAVVFVVVQTSKNCITVIVETETGQPWRTNTSESNTGFDLGFHRSCSSSPLEYASVLFIFILLL